MNSIGRTLAAAALALSFTAGCGANSGPRVRVATVTAAELVKVQDADMVWYEFQPGDVVPIHFGFIGAPEGGTDQPVMVRAKRRFFLVMRKNLPMLVSFDGETFAGPNSIQSVIVILPREDGGPGAQVGWLHYLGESGNPEEEIKALVDKGNAEKGNAEKP